MVSFGIADPSAGGMKGADFLIGWVDDETGEASIVDAYDATERKSCSSVLILPRTSRGRFSALHT